MPTFINFHTLKKLSLLITFFFATQSSAAEGFYIEPLLGVSEFGVAEVSNFTLSKSSTSKAFLVGYSLNQELAAELGWLDAGKLSYSTTTGGSASFFNGGLTSNGTWSGGIDVSAKGYLLGLSYVPFRSAIWDFGFRGGIYNYEAKATMNVSVSGTTYSRQFHSTITNPYYGLTLGYQLRESTRLGLNWLTFNDSDSAFRANIFAMSLRKSF